MKHVRMAHVWILFAILVLSCALTKPISRSPNALNTTMERVDSNRSNLAD